MRKASSSSSLCLSLLRPQAPRVFGSSTLVAPSQLLVLALFILVVALFFPQNLLPPPLFVLNLLHVRAEAARVPDGVSVAAGFRIEVLASNLPGARQLAASF